MSNINNNPELDDELAEMTDRLLAGEDMDVSPENQPLARIVKQVHRVVATGPAPDAAYRSRLTRRLNEEWDQVQRRSTRHLLDRPVFRFAALAASIVVVLAAVWLVLGQGGPIVTPGADVGQIDMGRLFPAIFILALILVAGTLWSRRR